MSPTQVSTEDALSMAADLDLQVAERRLRDALPTVPARETMVQETLLEYRRLLALRELGGSAQPQVGTLLATLLQLEHDEPAGGSAIISYAAVFGHAPPYPWSAPLDGLLESEPMPGGGGGADNCAM